MPFQYSFEEKTEMLLIFGDCGRDATLAAETYAGREVSAKSGSKSSNFYIISVFCT
jgi:hypothetical protein